ncbi:hypothetical protein MtrunA17_Chr2g0322281 [Medicago truncatula]|uniref:Uncharacterized protein n=1 Tax=Medicago truncatula TaxID=3880 RepID=G7IRI5_MEDTR|nr:uncharacterized protein LOC11420097 [Medicago truncatula]AES67187.2 hypothetical protein MTR_2g087830 [Medicago truncatula]RHN75532.1 hypothetical protein MtrunA17_Chr2g0322281 [Medicago truncatula]
MTRQNQLQNRRRSVGEVAGNATAECAAICCCVPCAVVDMVALATYKVPASLWKKAAINNRKKRLLKQMKKDMKNFLEHEKPGGPGPETVVVGPTMEELLAQEELPEEDLWARFSVNGFWRSSSSQKHEPDELQTGENNR